MSTRSTLRTSARARLALQCTAPQEMSQTRSRISPALHSTLKKSGFGFWVTEYRILTNFELGEHRETKRPDVEEAEVDRGEATEAHEQQPYAQRLHCESAAKTHNPNATALPLLLLAGESTWVTDCFGVRAHEILRVALLEVFSASGNDCA